MTLRRNQPHNCPAARLHPADQVSVYDAWIVSVGGVQSAQHRGHQLDALENSERLVLRNALVQKLVQRTA